MKSFGLSDVTLFPKVLWNEEIKISFFQKWADGGRIIEKSSLEQSIEIQTDKLSKYLDKKMDFLKIDIEGAEIIVLEECKNLLHNVERIFVEYHSFVDKKQTLHRVY